MTTTRIIFTQIFFAKAEQTSQPYFFYQQQHVNKNTSRLN